MYSLPYAKLKHYCIPLKVKTKDSNLEEKNQAVNTFTAHAYASKPGSQNYLHIDIPTEELKIGTQFFLSLTPITTQINHDITFLVCILTVSVAINVHLHWL